ncbi:MAG TPA: hypothetical protein VFH70_09480 [Acidimicrobiales bacterium]|nr:hypothetical protein [Acidimicrobiales bacterium]
MATFVITGDMLRLHLSAWERAAAFHGDITVPLRAVTGVEVDDNPFGSLRGMRAPGTGIPGVIAYGTRRYRGGRDFAAILARRPAVRVDLDPALSPFSRITVSAPDPEHVVRQISSQSRPDANR